MECGSCAATDGPFRFEPDGTPLCEDALGCNARALERSPCNSPEECEALTGAYSISDTYDPWD